ncbi:MAG TPA: LysR family transcriptional regulator [Alphaproteobacteria bacterium]|nr:LysR family transcriptional regulator [Alphaproteobacteria bacterium]
MNLAKLDLNLLLVFDALIRDGNATRAGQRLGLSQPAVSHALRRLRYVLEDQLFERGPEGMRPTPRARALATPVRQALLQIQTAIDTEPFVPAESNHRFTIASYNHTPVVLMPLLAERLRRVAPGVDLQMLTTDIAGFENSLDDGEFDFVLGTFRNPPKRCEAETLFEDRYMCVVGRDNPLTERQFTIERYGKAAHLTVAPTDVDRGWLDLACKARGIERRLSMIAPGFLSAALTLNATDMVGTFTGRVAERFAAEFGLKLLSLPVPCSPIPCMIMWHRLQASHPAHRWLRGQLSEVARTVPAIFRARDALGPATL